jgi:hypothetical protein
MQVLSSHTEAITGICGVPNGDSSDDFTKDNKQLAKNTDEFTSSWRLPSVNDACTSPKCSQETIDLAYKICADIP